MEAVPEPRVSKGQSRCLSGAGWVQSDSRHSLTVSHQQPGLTGGRTSLGNVGCVDIDLRLHLSLLFPLVLIFPSVLFCSEIFQDFSHHLGDLEMEILSKMCSLVFMLCKSKNKKPQTQFRTEWAGVEWRPCTRKTPKC